MVKNKQKQDKPAGKCLFYSSLQSHCLCREKKKFCHLFCFVSFSLDCTLFLKLILQFCFFLFIVILTIRFVTFMISIYFVGLKK